MPFCTNIIHLLCLIGSQGRTYRVSLILERGSRIEGTIEDLRYVYILPAPNKEFQLPIIRIMLCSVPKRCKSIISARTQTEAKQVQICKIDYPISNLKLN